MFIYVVACWTFLDSLGNKLCRASVTCIVFCNKRNGAASLHRSCIKFRHSIAVVFQCLCETYLHETVRMLCSNGHAGIQSRVAGNWRWAAEQVQDTCGAFGRPRFLLASCELKLDTVRECKWTRDQGMVSMYWSMIICLLENHRFRIGTYAILLCGGAVIMKIFLLCYEPPPLGPVLRGSCDVLPPYRIATISSIDVFMTRGSLDLMI